MNLKSLIVLCRIPEKNVLVSGDPCIALRGIYTFTIIFLLDRGPSSDLIITTERIFADKVFVGKFWFCLFVFSGLWPYEVCIFTKPGFF